MNYTIVALPKDNQLNKFNKLKKYFYTNNFRYINSENSSSVHITLAQFYVEDNFNFNVFKLLNSISKEKITIEKHCVVNEIHDWVNNNPIYKEKYPNGCSQVAIYFYCEKLFNLSDILVRKLKKLNIDTTDKYVENIKIVKGDILLGKNFYIGNHMNICNYAKIDMGEFAKKMIKKSFYGKIIIDKIGIRDEIGNIIYTVKFN